MAAVQSSVTAAMTARKEVTTARWTGLDVTVRAVCWRVSCATGMSKCDHKLGNDEFTIEYCRSASCAREARAVSDAHDDQR